MGLFIPIFKFRQQKSAEKLFTALPSVYGRGAASGGRRVVPPSGRSYILLVLLLHRREEVMQMVTYSDLIQIGILVVGVINLFLQVNNKKK